jgi:hypothetical protein
MIERRCTPGELLAAANAPWHLPGVTSAKDLEGSLDGNAKSGSAPT